MPILDASDFIPNSIFRYPHLGTLVPHFFSRKKTTSFERVRLNTPDGDFIDVDNIIRGHNNLVILCHGLEGSSSSNYIHNAAATLDKDMFDIVAINYRGCSGEPNRNLRMYHSGATDDIHFVISQFESRYKSIALIGYSLGANMVIKYNGEDTFKKSSKLIASVGISAPCDLDACSKVISRRSNYIYEKRFLMSLSNKLKIKAKKYPEDVNINLLKKVKTLRDFDNYFTGPIHGFKDADEYYQINSSNAYLASITKPTLIINALNDPFLDHNKFPYVQAEQSDYVNLMVPKYGGHVGFMDWGLHKSWADSKALEFIINNITQ